MLTDIVPSGFRALAPWRRQDEFADFQRGVGQLMREFFEDEPSLTAASGLNIGESAFMPCLDIQETDNKITVCAELAGLTEKEVEVSVDGEFLTLRGEKKDQKETRGVDRCFSERLYGTFERSVRLPESVDTDKITAEFSNGLLTVEVPKCPEARRDLKKIAIKH